MIHFSDVDVLQSFCTAHNTKNTSNIEFETLFKIIRIDPFFCSAPAPPHNLDSIAGLGSSFTLYYIYLGNTFESGIIYWTFLMTVAFEMILGPFHSHWPSN